MNGNGWQIKSLGEVANVKSGFAFKSEDYLNEGVRLVRIGNLTGSELEFNSNTVYVDKKYLKQYPDYTLTANDVLIAMSGATTGKLAFVKEGDLPCLLNQRVGLISIPKDSQLNSQYLFYYLAKGDLRKEVLKMAGGSAQPNISPTQIMSFKIPLPPLPIQKQIAEILEKADQAKQKRKEANKLTEQFLQSAFIEMFGDPVKNTKGWETTRIGELCKVGTGGTPSRDKPIYFTGSIPWVKTTEVNNNKIYDTSEKISELALRESNCTVFPKETILVALYGQGLTRGRASLLQIEACTNQACAAILPSEKFISLFLWHQLLHFYQHLRSISRGGNQPNLNLSFIKNLLVIDPPLSLQQQFAELVQKTETLKEKQKASEKELENLFNSLMQKAFKGELEFGDF